MHGFYVDIAAKNMRFDVVVSFDEKDRDALCATIADEVRAAFPEYTVIVQPDTDMSD
jgi:hypothetical protein